MSSATIFIEYPAVTHNFIVIMSEDHEYFKTT